MRYAKVNYSYDPETQTALQLEENQNGRTHMLASNNIRDTTVVEIYGKPVSNREKSNAALARRLEADKDKAEIWLNGLIEKSKRNPFGEVCKLTPALAVALLDRNPNNKNINSTILENIKCDINGGRWDFR